MSEATARVRSLVDSYLQRVDTLYPGLVIGVWLGGSIALKDFHDGVSDIDLFLLTRHKIKNIIKPSWFSSIQVEWLSQEELSGYSQSGDIQAITAATLYRHGITLRGPEPKSMISDVESSRLSACTLSNLRAYWIPWLKRARENTIEHLIALHPMRVQWGVFGVPRQYITIKEGRIVSKSEGVRLIRDIFEPRWHRMIDEALRLRHKQRGGLYGSPFLRRQEMLDFLEYSIEQSLRLS